MTAKSPGQEVMERSQLPQREELPEGPPCLVGETAEKGGEQSTQGPTPALGLQAEESQAAQERWITGILEMPGVGLKMRHPFPKHKNTLGRDGVGGTLLLRV